MGIEQTKSLLKTFYSTPLDTGDYYLKMAFSTECLQLDDFINFYWKEKSAEHLGNTNIPTKPPVNEREKEKYYLKEELIFNEIPISKQNPSKAFNIECLSEYRNSFIPLNSNKFSQMQMKRMNVLLFAYVRKILEDFNENSTIECISKYFDSLGKNKDKIDIGSLGINLFIKLVSDISKGNVQIKEKNLDFMLENNKFIRPLSFYGETKEHFILDKALDKIIEYLKELISDKNEKDINKIKALKIIFNLALAKGSIKNLLDVIVFLDKLPKKNIDFNYELNLFKNEFRKFGLGAPSPNNKRLDSLVWNFTLKREEEKDKSKQKKIFHTTTTDGSYLYYFSSKGILLKLGTGFNNTMLGKIYNKKEKYRVGEKATIAFVEGILYYRSNNLDPYPVISIDPETLEEIPNKYSVDYSEINHIFIEEKKSEFEFPHTSYEDMMEIIERKRTLGLDDKSNIRPSDSSPMITDGRFIYIISKWYDQEDEGEKKDEEDDGDINTMGTNKNKKSSAIFGVNIYDPLNNMCHVRSLQLIPISEENEEKIEKEKQNKNVTNLFNDLNLNRNQSNNYGGNRAYRNNRNTEENRWDDNYKDNKKDGKERFVIDRDFLQGQNKLYTNGAILYINQYKFSLVTGNLLGNCSLNSNVTNSYCYDFNNNLIWCINEESAINKIKITSFFNESAKIIYEYPKGHPKYSPCNIEKIIEICEKNIKLANLKEEVTNNNFKHQETLDLLCLEDEESKNYKEIEIINKNVENEKDNYSEYILNLQCFILNIIAKVSEYYGQVPDLKIASNDIEMGKILSQAMRRPFCVKLEPITLKELIKLLIRYSQNFIKEKYTDIEGFCLLAIVKIIRTNLKCLSISNLGIDYFLKRNSEDKINPFFQMKEFIFNIIKIYHDKDDNNDLFKAVYEECKIILKVSVNTLYQNNGDIVQILCDHLNNFEKSNYSKDIASCILYWISNQDNIHKILKNANEETINKIFDILKKVSSLEVLSLEKFLNESENNLENIEKVIFKNTEFERIFYEFISSLQLELIKFISKKLLNDQYEDSYYEKLIHIFTEILFNNLTKIFSSLKNYINIILKKIEDKYNEKYNPKISEIDFGDDIDEEEDMICTSSKVETKPTINKKENESENKTIPTLEEYKKEKMDKVYKNVILKKVLNNLFHIKILIFHINSLSILSSDYILSAYLLQDFIPLIKEMNEIYSILSLNCSMKTEEIFVKNEEYKEVIFESEHPYTTGVQKEFNLEIPGEKGPLYLEFDEKCQLCSPEEKSCPNAIYFYKDKKLRGQSYFPDIPKITTTFPKNTLEINTFPCYLIFNAYVKNTNNCYGFKVKLHNGKDINVKKEVSDDLFNLIRIVNWVGCKCSSVIIKGIFLKIPQGNDGNEKYLEIMKGNLFKEGIYLNEILNDNEKIIHNIVDIFNLYKDKFDFNIINNNYDEKDNFIENELNLFKDKKCINTLKLFQKKLVSKNLALNVGGEDGFKLVMVCFLAMIHHSGEMKDFIEKIVGKDENEIFSSPIFDSLYKKYILASQMRSWLVEKKKNIAESIEKKNKENEVNDEKDNDDGELKVENYVKKIINQATNKAKFLIKIKRNEDLEEEKDMNNICFSIISYLKENLSNKKLQRNIKINTLRAIGRHIGLEAIIEIFKNISNGTLLQDLLLWFNASLKYNNNFENSSNVVYDFNSYLDNILGCGEMIKTNIRNSFQNFLSILIKKYLQNSNENELESFFDTLIWKYNLDDHKFILEKSMFNIIWGLENETIKNAWGKSYMTMKYETKNLVSNNEKEKINNNSITYFYNNYYRSDPLYRNINSMNSISPINDTFKQLDSINKIISTTNVPSINLTNEVIEIFEILSSICLNSIIVNKEDNNYNLTYTSALIQNIINIIFGEIEKATNNYLEYRGISKRLVRQYQKFIEEGNNNELMRKKEKDKKVNEMIELIRQERIDEINRGELDYDSDDGSEYNSFDSEERERAFIERGIDREAIERQVSDLEKKKNEKEPKQKIQEKKYYFTTLDIENIYEKAIISNSKKEKKIYITPEELYNIISTQWTVIYNPKFLNRLLQILYKISIQNIKILLDCINSAEYLYSLIKLIKYCSTPEKLLSVKILSNLCVKSDEETLNEINELYFNDYGKTYNNFIELLIDNAFLIRKISWNYNTYNSSGNYIISNYLISIIRELVYSNKFNNEVNDLLNKINLNECKTKEDYIKKEIILGIVGADFLGQANGSRVQVPNPLFNCNSPFDFNKKSYEQKPLLGTVVGFSTTMNEFFGITESNSKKLDEITGNLGGSIFGYGNRNTQEKVQKALGQMNITPNNNMENKIGVLLDNSLINDENINVQELVPKVYNQTKAMPILNNINFDKFKIIPETIDYYIDFLNENIYKEDNLDNLNKNNNNIINLCTNIIRFLYAYFEYHSNNINNNIILSGKLIRFISENSKKLIYHGNNFMNLEYNEEKLYRIANYCNENKESLEEIPIASIKFVSNTNYLIRLYNNLNKNISLSNNIINIENKNNYNNVMDNGYHSFYIYTNKDNLLNSIKIHNQRNYILFVDSCENNVLDEIIDEIRNNKKNYKLSNFVIISDQIYKSLKKEDMICYIQIYKDELKEIIDIFKEIENKPQNGEYNNEILKMLFKKDKIKNEKEKLLNELINDFGFDKENLDIIIKESPDMDLNDIISHLIEMSKPDDNRQNIEMAMEQQGNSIQREPMMNLPTIPPPIIMDIDTGINLEDYEFHYMHQNELNNLHALDNLMRLRQIDNNNYFMNMNTNNNFDNNIGIDRPNNINIYENQRREKKEKKEKKEMDPIEKKIEEQKKKEKGENNIEKKNKEKKELKEEDDKKENEDESKDNERSNEEEDMKNKKKIESLCESGSIQIKEEKEEKIKNDDKLEKEEKNDCFGFDNEKNRINLDEFETDLFINKLTDESNLFLIYKNLNKKINILYSRRLIISLLKLSLSNENSNNLDIFIETVSKEDLYNIIKLLVHEGLFINLIELGAELLLSIKNILLKLIKSKNKKNKELIEYFINKSIEEINIVNESPSFEYKSNYCNEVDIIESPFIFFNVWIIMIFCELEENIDINNIHKNYYNIFNALSGLIPKIKENKEIRWFILDTLINYCQSILSILNSDKKYIIIESIEKENIIKFQFIPNIIKLDLYLKQSINNEGIKSLSKRTQMITEVLILISSIDKRIKQIRNNKKEINEKEKENELLENKFRLKKLDKNDIKYKEIYGDNKQGELHNFINELLSTSSIMKNFFKKNYIKYLAWNQINQDKIIDNEFIFESNHLYSKAPITYLLAYPDVNNYEIKLDNISYFDEGDCIIFSEDKNCKNIIKCVLSDNQNKFTLSYPYLYVTFPGTYISKLYAFGINNFGKLGITANIKDISSPKLISQLSNIEIEDIKIGDTSCVILTKDGELLSAGYSPSVGLDSASDIFKIIGKFRTDKYLSNEKVNRIGMYNQNLMINTKNGEFWSIGNNIQGLLGHDFSSNIDELKCIQFTIKSNVTSLSLGTNHTLITTSDGKLYFIGANDKIQSGDNSIGIRINLPKEISYKKTDFFIMASAGDSFSAFIIKDKKTGLKKLYTCGWGKDGRSGIDEKGETHSIHMFEDSNNNEREFIYVSTSETTGAAISKDGKLYTWGSNNRGECGQGSYNIINVPTLVKFFDKDYFVLDVCAISQATIVIAKNIKNNKVSLFCMGDNSCNRLGMSIQSNYEVKDTYPIPYINPFFEGKNPEKIYGGSKGVIIKCKSENIKELRDNFNCICLDCNKVIYGKMGYNIEDKKLICDECSENEINKNKNIIIFKARLPEKNSNLTLEKIKEIFNEQKIEKEKNENKLICEGCKEEIIINEINKYYYTYHNIENKNEQIKDKKIIRKYLCSYCLDHFPSCLTNIKIFYRNNNINELITCNSLEKLLNEEKYYDISSSYGYKFSVSLTYNDEGCEKVILKHKNEFDSFTKDLKEVNKFEVYEQFVDYLNEMSQKAEKSLFSYNPKDLTFKKENLSVRSELVNCSNEVLKKMFVLLKILNIKVKELLPYIDFSKSLSDSQRLSDIFTSISPLIFWDIKNEILQYYLEKTSFNCVSNIIKINRFKAKKYIEKGKPDILGEHTVFGQVFQFLRTYPFKIFRKKKVDSKNINAERNNKLFSATFIGEASIDAGGPYRECLATIYTELQSNALSLFIPTPNQKNDSGSFREKWTVNPGAVSNIELEMFKIFGGLMGYAIRTGEFFNMDLCSIFWKSILDIEKDRKDLEKFDKYCVQFLDNIEYTNDKDSFVLFTDYKFATALSNGTEIELCENGNNIFLSLENKKLYINLVEKARLNEGNVQIQAVKNGLEQVIPIGLLKLLSWNELEMLVCGKPILDVELLKENTLYSGCSENDELIKNFWKCLEEFSAEERASYLRFVWGRSRLPLTSKDFPMQHRISIMSHGKPDVALPTSHTCFFSIDIPRYSSYDNLKSKLKYAITHCQAIDTDGGPREIWDDED